VIRAWRQRVGLTQEGLAQALSVTFSTVSRWENGHVLPSKLAWRALQHSPTSAASASPTATSRPSCAATKRRPGSGRGVCQPRGMQRRRHDRSTAPRGAAEPELNRPFRPRAHPAGPPRAAAARAGRSLRRRPAATGGRLALRRAMDGVVPLAPEARERVDGAAPAAQPRVPVSEESEALAALADLVAGEVYFDVSDTREYLEGFVHGLDPRLVRQLAAAGSPGSAIDLHGHTAAGPPVVERFLLDSMRAGTAACSWCTGAATTRRTAPPCSREARLVALAGRALAHGAGLHDGASL
jgi:hypothetical protein